MPSSKMCTGESKITNRWAQTLQTEPGCPYIQLKEMKAFASFKTKAGGQ